jgi:hypothetical protein
LDRFAFRKKHVKKGVRTAVCEVCEKGGMTELSLRIHLQNEHQYLPCKACRKIFPDAATVQDHNCPLQAGFTEPYQLLFYKEVLQKEKGRRL